MNLVVDIGNSSVKICLFENNTIVKQGIDRAATVHSLSHFCQGFSIDNVIISTVVDSANELFRHFKKICKNTILLDETTKLPIINLYESPQTLGRDRIAAAVGANDLYPNQNILIIDAGTAITIDVVSNKKQFLGGNISPGLNTRFKSLHNYTNKLPLLESKNLWSVLGTNTETAIISGVQQGIVFEIEGYISHFKAKFGQLLVVCTGGDAEIVTKQLKEEIIIEPYLVFKGLNRIVQYNAS